ncbi:MAG: hypothetical protein KDJ67_05830 [Nitratireductor sp.]|nr:hypothetical protein [Nitratireductor sp.]
MPVISAQNLSLAFQTGDGPVHALSDKNYGKRDLGFAQSQTNQQTGRTGRKATAPNTDEHSILDPDLLSFGALVGAVMIGLFFGGMVLFTISEIIRAPAEIFNISFIGLVMLAGLAGALIYVLPTTAIAIFMIYPVAFVVTKTGWREKRHAGFLGATATLLCCSPIFIQAEFEVSLPLSAACVLGGVCGGIGYFSLLRYKRPSLTTGADPQ